MTTLVVFVHGLGANENEFWGGTPKAIRECNLLESQTVIRFWGYETTKKPQLTQRLRNLFGASDPLESVDSLGEHLWSKLGLWFRDGQFSEVRLLGHSMGGLVVSAAVGYGLKRNASRDEQLINALSAVAFVATPLGGAELATKTGTLFMLAGENVQVADLKKDSESRASVVDRFISYALKKRSLSLTIFRASNDEVVNPSEVDEPLVNDSNIEYRTDVVEGSHSGCVQDLSTNSDNLKMLVHWAKGKLTAVDIAELGNRGKPVSIFISRPTALNEEQVVFLTELENILSGYGLKPRTLGVTDPMIADGGMHDVLKLMQKCNGALVVGFSQMRANQATFRANTSREEKQEKCAFATPWNHMEACMAFAQELPMLIVREKGVQDDGIFDRSCLRLVSYETDLDPDWLSRQGRFEKAMDYWVNEVAGVVASRR